MILHWRNFVATKLSFGISAFFFCLISSFAVAQLQVFTPATEDDEKLKALTLHFEKRYQQNIASLASTNKKDLADAYKKRWENIKVALDKKEIYTSPTAQVYLDQLLTEIVKANPVLQKQEVNCYFSRSGIPNASYIGEGIILFNMGLFERLQNESQVAFTLCHELAHFYLKHSEKSIDQYVAKINSPEFKEELKNIKKSEYGRGKLLLELTESMSFNYLRHSRDHESEADSLGFEWMSNTRFNAAEAIKLLAILDSIDTDTLQTSDCLQKTFNANDYPFQKKWLAKEEGLLGGHAVLKTDEKLADSLKTHPDCKVRMKALESLLSKKGSQPSHNNVVDTKLFYELQNTFRYEVVEYAFRLGNYTRSLFYTLQLLQQHPHDPYLTAQTGKVLNGFYSALKNHTLAKLIDLPSPKYAPNYNLLLQFVQNLYRENFASLSYHFLKTRNAELGYYEPFKSAYQTSIQIATE